MYCSDGDILRRRDLWPAKSVQRVRLWVSMVRTSEVFDCRSESDSVDTALEPSTIAETVNSGETWLDWGTAA